MDRIATVSRQTKETQIAVTVNLDGSGKSNISTKIGFFDHMLTAFSAHSGVDMQIQATGDLYVDCHHTIEDTGIVLGQAFAKALDDKSGITRYGHAMIPMDEALGVCALDISGRPYLVFDCKFTSDRMGEMDTQMVEEFFRAFAFHAGITLHLNVLYGQNDHHKAEALFKAAAHALQDALFRRVDGSTLSTKGSID